MWVKCDLLGEFFFQDSRRISNLRIRFVIDVSPLDWVFFSERERHLFVRCLILVTCTFSKRIFQTYDWFDNQVHRLYRMDNHYVHYNGIAHRYTVHFHIETYSKDILCQQLPHLFVFRFGFFSIFFLNSFHLILCRKRTFWFNIENVWFFCFCLGWMQNEWTNEI